MLGSKHPTYACYLSRPVFTPGMIDIHSHILPGLDDGAQSLEEGLDMLRLAAASGTTDIVATPHCNDRFPFNAQLVAQAVSQLKAHSEGVVQIHSGCDFHLTYDSLQDALAHPTKYTVNQGPYLLVELPELVALPSTRQALRHLLGSGMVPVITHPERNLSLRGRVDELRGWVSDGCLVQVTAGSVLGFFGSDAQNAAYALLKTRLVHFIASDAHNTSRRSPDLSVAFKRVSARYGSDYADALFRANPSAVIHGTRLPPRRLRPSLFGKLRGFCRKDSLS